MSILVTVTVAGAAPVEALIDRGGADTEAEPSVVRRVTMNPGESEQFALESDDMLIVCGVDPDDESENVP